MKKDTQGIAVMPIPGKGRGVIAQRDFKKGEVLERAPVIVVPPSDVDKIHETMVDHYWYEWGEDGSFAIVGGYGSFYNHSFEPNADFFKDIPSLTMEYIVLRAIKAGEEVILNYNGPGYDYPVGFDVK